MPCPFGIPNHLVVDADRGRARRLVTALNGDANVADSVQAALDIPNPGCVTVLVSSDLMGSQERNDLPIKYADWWIVAYDTQLPPNQVVNMLSRYKDTISAQRRTSSFVDLPPEGLEVLRLYGHVPQREGNKIYYG